MADQPCLDAGERQRLPIYGVEIDAELAGEHNDDRQRFRIGFAPEGSEFTQEDIRGHGTDAVELPQPAFQFGTVLCGLMQTRQTAVVGREQCLAVAQDLH